MVSVADAAAHSTLPLSGIWPIGVRAGGETDVTTPQSTECQCDSAFALPLWGAALARHSEIKSRQDQRDRGDEEAMGHKGKRRTHTSTWSREITGDGTCGSPSTGPAQNRFCVVLVLAIREGSTQAESARSYNFLRPGSNTQCQNWRMIPNGPLAVIFCPSPFSSMRHSNCMVQR